MLEDNPSTPTNQIGTRFPEGITDAPRKPRVVGASDRENRNFLPNESLPKNKQSKRIHKRGVPRNLLDEFNRVVENNILGTDLPSNIPDGGPEQDAKFAAIKEPKSEPSTPRMGL